MVIIIVLSFINMFAAAQTDMRRAANINLAKKVAIQGYDPLSYLKQRKAVKGTNHFTATYDGATYLFSSAANKEIFLKNPAAYEPQYGGWCAYAMGSTGEKVEVDPETFKIIDGKLYLFYNAYFNNTLKSWNKNETELRKKADTNWKKINQ